LQEIYYLAKYLNFSHSDIVNLPIFERKFYLDMLLKEFEKKNEMAERAKNKRK
tara:strand:+ start:627 stop:785 length:159 start_codon:yes stop_codon:yes gene_type:complete